MNGIELNGKIISIDDDGMLLVDGKAVAGSSISSTWKYFDGDGDTTDFDCETNIDIIQVSIDGSCITPKDFDKDGTVISFKEAPVDDAEIDIQIFSSSSLLEEYKYFDGDGNTTDFDCEINIDIISVSIDGYMISPRDFKKDGTTISFDATPDDGTEISVWILKQK